MLKGHTKIELKNEKTGEIQVVEKNNMVTNAIQDLFDCRFATLNPYIFNMSGMSDGNILPLCPNAIGSILLFEKQLDNDKDNIIAPIDNTCIGYASNDVNTTQNTKRGSMNQTESGPIENGYKLVWDFSTSQGNGEISAIALSHKLTGINYIGDTFGNSRNIVQAVGSIDLTIQSNNPLNITDPSDLITSIVEFNIPESKVIGLIIKDNIIYIVNINIIGTKVTLTNDINNFQYTELHKLSNTTFASISTIYHNLIDGKNGYWYIFEISGTSINSLSDTLYWIKIKKDDYSYTEGNMVMTEKLENDYLRFAQMSDEEYLYIMSITRDKFIKINLNNFQDITQIPLGFTSKFTSGNSGWADVVNNMWKYYNYFVCSDFIFDPKTDIAYQKQNCMNPLFTKIIAQNKLYNLAFYYNNNSYARRLYYCLLPYYLATKNNLDTPVTKTSEQSMKITYTLTEES